VKNVGYLKTPKYREVTEWLEDGAPKNIPQIDVTLPAVVESNPDSVPIEISR
jgi:hypothetical protein